MTTESTTQLPQMAPQVTEEEINSEVELLQSRDVLEKVVLTCGLQNASSDSWLSNSWFSKLLPGHDKGSEVDRAVETLGKQLKVKIVPKTNLINVSYRSKDPKLAFEVLNNLANLYLEKHVAVHRPAGSYEFFTKEADRYREALQESEAHLASFDTQEGLVAPDEERTNMGLKLADSIAALHVAQQSIAADERRIHDVQSQMRATPQRSTTQQVSNSADLLLQQLQGNLLTAQVNRGQLLMKYDPSYPLVQQVDQQIKQTQTAIEEAEKTKYVNQTTDRDPTYEFLREDMAKTQADLASQKATATALERTIAPYEQRWWNWIRRRLNRPILFAKTKLTKRTISFILSKREQERTSDASGQEKNRQRGARHTARNPRSTGSQRIPDRLSLGIFLVDRNRNGCRIPGRVHGPVIPHAERSCGDAPDTAGCGHPQAKGIGSIPHMFLDYYNLREQPFGVTPDPRYLYQSRTHREAMASLFCGVTGGRGFMALIARPGMGKDHFVVSADPANRRHSENGFSVSDSCESEGFSAQPHG